MKNDQIKTSDDKAIVGALLAASEKNSKLTVDQLVALDNEIHTQLKTQNGKGTVCFN